MKPHRAPLILVFGILGLIWPLGFAAWILGSGDLKQMDAGAMDPSGRSTTNVGRICGLFGSLLGIFGFLIGLILMALFGFLANHKGG